VRLSIFDPQFLVNRVSAALGLVPLCRMALSRVALSRMALSRMALRLVTLREVTAAFGVFVRFQITDFDGFLVF
jgi:hypothetical protein